MYTDGRFVGPESDNLQATLQFLGHTVLPGGGEIAEILRPGNVPLFPSFERADPWAITQTQQTALSNYVVNGGTIIVHGCFADPTRTARFIETFGLTVTAERHPYDSQFLVVTQSVAGTSFAGGPATIAANFEPVGLRKALLPPRAVSLYENSIYSGVVILPVRDGQIIFLGWNWYNAAPRGTQNNGWLSVLGAAVTTAASPPPPRAPLLEVQPADQAVFSGSAAHFRVLAFGTRPLSYQWRWNGALIAGETNSELVINNVTTNHIGLYSVRITNSVGSIMSGNARLTVLNSPSEVFKIASLGTNNSRVEEHEFLTGNDRGGIAMSSTHVVYIGDTGPAAFQADDLSHGRQVPFYDLVASDLRTETLYALTQGTNVVPQTITTLVELTNNAVEATGRRTPISVPIPFQSGGIFSGWGRIVVHNGTRIYSIELPSGTVLDLGAMTLPPARRCDHRAFWGVAEQFDNAIHLAYVKDDRTISRTRLPDGAETSISAFAYLSDMCSFTVSPSMGRWYFHHERSSSFGGREETIGYADAMFTYPPRPIVPEVRVQPQNRAAFVGSPVTFEARVAGPEVKYQWLFRGVPIAGANTNVLRLSAVTAAEQGLYTLVVSNSLGVTVSSNASLTVFDPGPTFRIVSLTSNRSEVIDYSDRIGFGSYGFALSASHAFASSWSMIRAPLGDLSELEPVNGPNNGILASDLASERVFLLARSEPLSQRVTALLELDGESGLTNGVRIELTEPIDLAQSSNGIFSGWGRIVVHNGQRVYSIELPSGSVIDLGPAAQINQHGSPHFLYTGVAEYHAGAIHLVYVQWIKSIVRMRVPNGPMTQVASFDNLGEMLQFSVMPALGRWYFGTLSSQFRSPVWTGSCLGFADATFEIPFTTSPPRIRIQPRNQFAYAGGTTVFKVSASGSELQYQWLYNGAAIPGANAESLALHDVKMADEGEYSVTVSNSLGTSISSAALLIIAEPSPQFAIRALTTNNLSTLDQTPILLKKWGGMALSSAALLCDGAHLGAVRFELPGLTAATLTFRQYLFPVSDLRTETVYLLGNGTNEARFDSPATSLLEVDGATGLITGRAINLSQSILLSSLPNLGIFAGYGRVVIHANGRVYGISIPSGVVVDLGLTPIPAHTPCGIGAYWGVAELIDGATHLVYAHEQLIARTRVPSGSTTLLGTFPNFREMCSIAVSPSRGTWYFNYNAAPPYFNPLEMIGYADASFDVIDAPPIPVIVHQPENATVLEGGEGFLSVTASGRVSDYQWLHNNTPITGATNRTLRVFDAGLENAGAYRVIVGNSSGSTTSSNALLSVIRAEAEFRLGLLSAAGARILNCDVGRAPTGIACSDSGAFYSHSGDDITARLNFDGSPQCVATARRYPVMVSELASGEVYALAEASGSPAGPGSTVNSLAQISGTTLRETGVRINLSRSIILRTNFVGIFSGFGRVGIYDGRRFQDIVLPSGVVTDRGSMVGFQCGDWATWGVLESFSNALHLAYIVYIGGFPMMARHRVPQSSPTILGDVIGGSGICSFGLSVRQRRWSFHHPGGGVGYANASFTVGNSPPLLSRISSTSTLEDAPVTVRFSIFDPNTPLNLLTISVRSSNTNLVPEGNMTLGGSGTERMVTIVPAPERSGTAMVTIEIRDPGGASALRTFELTVLPVNDPPVAIALPSSVTVVEDGSASVLLSGSDPEGTPVAIAVVTQPQNGVLHQTPTEPTRFRYEPNPNYNGPDSFQFRAFDGTNYSERAVVSITVTPVNDAPLSIPGVWSRTVLATNDSNVVIVAPNNLSAEAIFDGSLSYDVDHDPLEYLWFEAGQTNQFGTGILLTNTLAIGSYEVVLAVNDAQVFGTATIMVEVITPAEGVSELIFAVNDSSLSRGHKRVLIASLKTAQKSFEEGKIGHGIKGLEAFQQKVEAKIARENPILAETLLLQGERLIEALTRTD